MTFRALGDAHGHVLIVVRGHLANGKYPTAYWRSENALTVFGGLGKTANFSEQPLDRHPPGDPDLRSDKVFDTVRDLAQPRQPCDCVDSGRRLSEAARRFVLCDLKMFSSRSKRVAGFRHFRRPSAVGLLPGHCFSSAYRLFLRRPFAGNLTGFIAATQT